MKLRIFYRHYNISGNDIKRNLTWFDYESCFKNLLSTIQNDPRVELHVIMDGDIKNNWIETYSNQFILHQITAGNDYQSFIQTYSYARDISTNIEDLFYFLENDYLHVHGWVEKVFELFSTYRGLDYISLYDHNDKYFLSMYDDLVSKIFTTNSHHWRTTPSTCGTYIVNKKVFLEDYDVPFQMSGDHHKFIFLNQTKGRFVYTPIPGLSTHCMEGLLSPTINWEKEAI
jgi:hypothetical protein